MGKLPKFNDPMLLVGTETADDAAVYRISEELAMIQTVDFFTPVVDDPYLFGQIAAANALSDVYAMGGEPKVALNLAAFPDCLDIEILGKILQGGADKVMEAGAVLAGGHTISDNEPKYGLCVSGFVDPKAMWKNYGAQPGDVLILTKPLGTGIISTAIKGELASEEEISSAVKTMTALNKYARDIAVGFEIHSCTDITGFGLAGHAMEMAKGSEMTLVLHTDTCLSRAANPCSGEISPSKCRKSSKPCRTMSSYRKASGFARNKGICPDGTDSCGSIQKPGISGRGCFQ